MPKDPESFNAAIATFTDPRTNIYDVFGHAQSQAGYSKQELIDLLEEKMPDDDYCFPDVAPWIKRHRTEGVSLVILSVGTPEYQSLKFRRAPSCAHIPKHVVTDTKGDLLRPELKGQKRPYTISLAPGTFDEIFLVDDRTDHLEGLQDIEGLTTVFVARPDGKYSTMPVSNNINITISQLGELE
jgi:methionine salvage enolase-phosphatase E1